MNNNHSISSFISSSDIDADKLFVSPKYIKANGKIPFKSAFCKKLFLAQQLTPHTTVPSAAATGNNTTSPLWCFKFSHDGRFLAAGGKDGYITIYKLISSPLDRLDYEHQQGSQIMTQQNSVRSGNSTVNSDHEYLNLPTSTKRFNSHMPSSGILSTASSATSLSSADSASVRSVNSNSNDNTGSRNYLKNLSPMKSHFPHHKSHHNHHYHFSPSSDSFPVSNHSRQKLYAPVFHDTPYRQFKAHNSDILSMDWSKNGFLLTSSNDKNVKIWHLEKHAPLQTYVHPHIVSSVAWHPTDDRFFITGCLDTKLRLFSVLENKVVRMVSLNNTNGMSNSNSDNKRKHKKMKLHADEMISSIVFYPRGERIVVGTVNGTIAIFETKTFKKIHTFNIALLTDIANANNSHDGNFDSLNSMLKRKLFKHDNSSGSDMSASSSSTSTDESSIDKKTSFKISGLECFDVIQDSPIEKSDLSAASSEDGNDDISDNIDTRILISSNDSTIRLYSCSKRKMLMRFKGHQNNSSQLQAVSNPGFSGNSINVANMNNNAAINGMGSSVNNHAFILSPSEDDYFYIWNVNDPEVLSKNLKRTTSAQRVHHLSDGGSAKGATTSGENTSSSSSLSALPSSGKGQDTKGSHNSKQPGKKLGMFNQIFHKSKHADDSPSTPKKEYPSKIVASELGDRQLNEENPTSVPATSSTITSKDAPVLRKPLLLNSNLAIESPEGLKNGNCSYIHAHNAPLTGAMFVPWRSKNLLYLSNDPIYDLNKVFLDMVKTVTSNENQYNGLNDAHSVAAAQMNALSLNNNFSPSAIKIINEVNDTMRRLVTKFTNDDISSINKLTPSELFQCGINLLRKDEVLMAEFLENNQKKSDIKTKDTILTLLNPLNFEIIVSCDTRGYIRVFRFDSGSEIRKVIQENMTYEMENNSTAGTHSDHIGCTSTHCRNVVIPISLRKKVSSNSTTSLLTAPHDTDGRLEDGLSRSGSLHQRMGNMMRRLTMSNHHGSSCASEGIHAAGVSRAASVDHGRRALSVDNSGRTSKSNNGSSTADIGSSTVASLSSLKK